MTDNRDMDEILASLDALLREGDSHNDDMPVETTSPEADTDVLDVALDADVESIEASVAGAFNSDDVGEEPVAEAVFDGVVAQQEDGMSRVVLTEDMMVENPQVSLPLAFNPVSASENHVVEDEDSELETLPLDDVVESVAEQDVLADEPMGDEESSSHPVEYTMPNQVMRLHKQEVEQLLALVSLDVSNHLQEMLPKLIKESLHTHLADMQHESDKNNKTSDDE